jgi:pyrroloquinoline quinone biosynthesis protein D
MTPDSVPRFAPGTKFRFDEVRSAWIVLAPERLFLPDEHAVEVLKLVDGIRAARAIVDGLAARFAAPREEIEGDVLEMLRDLAERGVLRS